MEQTWWERVPDALMFTSDIVECLLDEKSIVLNCSGAIPWYFYMVNTVKDSVKQQNSIKRFETFTTDDEPGKYLLHEYCKPEKRAEYRPSKTYARFLAENDDIVLHERYLWVKISSKEQLDSWSNFVSEYIKGRGKNKDVAVFILEWIGGGAVTPKKGIKLISFDNYINEYDRIVFCTLASSAAKENPFLKNYMTELASNIAGNDIELCAACLEEYNRFLQSPYDALKDILASKTRSDGCVFYSDKSEEEINKLTWLAQIKSIYPALEEYREEFVQKHKNAILKQLPITSSYGETYNEPNDVELGTLKFMADNGNLNLNYPEYERLRIYKDARNKLSHLTPLTLEEIKKLGL